MGSAAEDRTINDTGSEDDRDMQLPHLHDSPVIAMGDAVGAHGHSWKRVADMGGCQRGTKPIKASELKGYVVTATTRPVGAIGWNGHYLKNLHF